MRTIIETLAILVLVGSCTGAHRDVGGDANDSDAAMTCGGEVCDQAPSATCVDGDTLRAYEASCEAEVCSYPSTELECGVLGCCGDHCCGVTPSNAIEIGMLAQTGLEVEALDGTFDTDAECTDDSRLGHCSIVARTDLPEACVCRADRIRIGSLRVTGSRALVLLAWRDVLITDVLDVSADSDVDGPGASAAYAEPPSNRFTGGNGGSFGSKGGSASGGGFASTYGAPTLIPLAGGMRGQPSGAAGGGGGGAVQITAGQRIEIVGVINAGGGGGRATPMIDHSNAGGGGGGSGGAILLEAPSVTITGKLLANGGGGAGGAGQFALGQSGRDAASAANGAIDASASGGYSGRSCSSNYGDGGAGAAGTTGATNGVGGASCNSTWQGAGGGGGGFGRIRINSIGDCGCSGTISPTATVGTVLTR